jgi:N-terminal acetyltransferase B complex catalytic subunit
VRLPADSEYCSRLIPVRYVRCANHRAIEMYEGMGYSVYRRVREYYGNLGLGKGGRDEEDAFGMIVTTLSTLCANRSMPDMRKPLKRDPHRKSVRPGGREQIIHANEAP